VTIHLTTLHIPPTIQTKEKILVNHISLFVVVLDYERCRTVSSFTVLDA